MGDVNFLANEKKDDEKKGEKKEEIKWSEGKEGTKKDDGSEKSGEKKGVKNSSVKDADISSWLKSLKEGSGMEGKGVKELKTSKEALEEYQKVFHQSKQEAEMKKGIKEATEKGELVEKPRGGIADIIKNKLSFGGRGDEAGTTLKTNLIKSEGVTFFDWKVKAKVVTINLLLTFLIMGTAYGYLEYRERGIGKKSDVLLASIKTLKGEIEELEKEIEVVDQFQQKVKVVSELLEKHIYWTNFFTFLEENLLASVYLDSNFEGDVSGLFRLFSSGKNFTDLTNQSRVIRQKEEVVNVKIESGEAVTGGDTKEQQVSFVMDLEMVPSIYYK